MRINTLSSDGQIIRLSALPADAIETAYFTVIDSFIVVTEAIEDLYLRHTEQQFAFY